jgi:hypothetical protein
MAQRLAMKTKVRESEGDRIVFFSDMREFVRRAEELGFGPKAQVRTEWDEEEQEFFFWVPIPGSSPRLADGRRRVVRRKTKTQVAADQQIADHKDNVAKGIHTKGHIPAVGPNKKKRKIVRKKS